MNRLFKLQNTIQPYAWGSRTAIPELLGQTKPSDHPQAELWMGAHSKASSKIWYQGRWQSLDELIRQDPMTLLGSKVVDQFGPRLPFLFKVLAVDQPLSIQAHPTRQMALAGFARESAESIPLSAPHRNYKDDQHKPELICALTPFKALCGFRPTAQILALLEPLWPVDRRIELDILQSENHLRSFFMHLMQMEARRRIDLTSRVISAAQGLKEKHPAYGWLVHLSEFYPNDIGILSPALLHCIELQPGQALFLPAGRLHAYLNGLAIEIMANSDNVLRGGLTPKHIDVEELLRVLDFTPHPLQILQPEPVGPQEQAYPRKAEEFTLSSISVQPAYPHTVTSRREMPEIFLCLEGKAQFSCGNSKGLELNKGESAFVPASVTAYEIEGRAVLYKASVGN